MVILISKAYRTRRSTVLQATKGVKNTRREDRPRIKPGKLKYPTLMMCRRDWSVRP